MNSLASISGLFLFGMGLIETVLTVPVIRMPDCMTHFFCRRLPAERPSKRVGFYHFVSTESPFVMQVQMENSSCNSD